MMGEGAVAPAMPGLPKETPKEAPAPAPASAPKEA
jgi:hypothetical protein